MNNPVKELLISILQNSNSQKSRDFKKEKYEILTSQNESKETQLNVASSIRLWNTIFLKLGNMIKLGT